MTVSYRLGALGFLPLGLEDGGSGGMNGIHDVIVALKWLRENGRAFGADVDRVTVSGQLAPAPPLFPPTNRASASAEKETHADPSLSLSLERLRFVPTQRARERDWRKESVSHERGDKRERTLARGRSSGGYATCALCVSPLAVGLFQRAVVQSGPCVGGPPGRGWGPDGDLANARNVTQSSYNLKSPPRVSKSSFSPPRARSPQKNSLSLSLSLSLSS